MATVEDFCAPDTPTRPKLSDAWAWLDAQLAREHERWFPMAALGYCSGQARTWFMDAPTITRESRATMVEGRVESVSTLTPKRARIVLQPTRIGKATDKLPIRVRITVMGEKRTDGLVPGAQVSMYAVLRSPPQPAEPGGYDFARWAFFEGIGGVGYAYGSPKILSAPSPTLYDKFQFHVESLRLAMTRRIQDVLPGDDGAIAAELITGETTAISMDGMNAYRNSGLQHVLSISGLHMALAGLGIFWIVRAGLALWPRVALTQPIKKWAAAAAFLGSTFYLFLSGASAPAARSYIMFSCMLLAIIADRPALSMRAVALSAFIILIIAPENLTEPSFEMSYAAIIGLIALAEWHQHRSQEDLGEQGVVMRVLRYCWKHFAGTFVSSIVATLATAPIAIFHFDRAGGYGLLSNLLALPLVGTVIMPAASAAVVLMPFGLDYWPLKAMGWGVHWMTAIALWVGNLPGAAILLRSWSLPAILSIMGGGVWLCLWQRRWRWFGLAPIVAGFVLIGFSPPPDILLAADAHSAAVRGPDGHFILLGAKLDDYSASQWLLRDGDSRKPDEARKGSACDENGCVAESRGGQTVALSLRASSLSDDCERADILLAAVPVRAHCDKPQTIVDKFTTLRGGAVAIYLQKDGARVVTAAEERGDRPWTNTKRTNTSTGARYTATRPTTERKPKPENDSDQ